MHIVITDSSQTILDIVRKQVLASGNSVTAFADGAEALDYINSDAPMDILLTGLELPNISGLELCWAANSRNQAGAPNYIIVMSSSSNVDKLVEALDSGADDFLKKPFIQDELRARLRAAERVLRAQLELVRLASIDPLTNALNRRAFFEKVEGVLKDKKNATPSAMIMMDIDHFKKVNDSFGHHAGDVVLTNFCKSLLKGNLMLGRLGGEEFAAFLPLVNGDEAFKIAEKIRTNIAEQVVSVDTIPISVTCSLGVSEFNGDDTLDGLLKRADQALYAAKNNGRNQTIVWGSELHHASVEDAIYDD